MAEKSSTIQMSTKPKLLLALIDSWIMIKRSSTHILRNTDQLLGTFFQPIMFLVLFATVFGGAIEQSLPEGVTYLNFLMAGIIVQTVAFGSTTTAIAVCNDLQRGIVDRFKSLPMNNLAVLNGHVISDLLRNTISTVVMIVTGLIMGFRSSASVTDWLLIAGVLLLFTFTFSWLAAIIGVITRSVEAVQWLTFVLIFPLTFASSAFVQPQGMPDWLRVFAQHQPISVVIDTVRALILGDPLGNKLWLSIAWCLGALIIAVPVAAYLFKHRASSN